MKGLSRFIVAKRYWIFGIMLGLTVICAVLSLRVSVNTDMTKYLPEDSSMKIGMGIMEAEFPDLELSSTIRIMAEGLSEEQKAALLAELEALPYVDSVAHDDSEDYNQENYSLFVISTSYDYGSAEELAIEEALETGFDAYAIVYQNDDDTFEGISPILLITAIFFLMVILFIMSESWFEPLLFLLTIGFAVILNSGTNIFRGEISNITSSVAGILQLVLSMDYSIILINRYRQEKTAAASNQEAMAAALAHSFGSIVSSSLTTVVGLLALTFMDFKIGMDLGIVLAKGVFISMVCVITILPCLILLCDKLIVKTAKKALHIPMGGAARFSYRFRYVMPVLFIAAFLGFSYFQNNTQIAYTLEAEDAIADIFPSDNMLVMVYDNGDEEQAAQLAVLLEDYEGVEQVLGYPNLLGRQYTADELADSLAGLGDSLGADLGDIGDLEPALLKMIYYHYYDGETDALPMSDFLAFLSGDVLADNTFADVIDEEMREQAERLAKFSDSEELTTKKSIQELADFLDLDTDTVKQLFVLYYTASDSYSPEAITMPQLMTFLNEEILEQERYADAFDDNARGQLQDMSSLISCAASGQALSSSQMAAVLGMEEMTVTQMYFLYGALSGMVSQQDMAGITVTLPEFTGFLVNNVLTDETYAGYFDDATKAQLTMLNLMVQSAASSTACTYEQSASMLGMDSLQMKQLYLLYCSVYGDTAAWQLDVQTMVNFLNTDVLADSRYAGLLNEELRDMVSGASVLIDAVVSGKEYSASEAYGVLSALTDELEENTVELLYFYIASQKNADPDWTLSLEEMLNDLCDSLVQDSRFASFLDEEMQGELEEVRAALEEGVEMLKTDSYSRLILYTKLPLEGEETTAFITQLHDACAGFGNEYYLIGNSAMNYEMRQTFGDELQRITLLTSVAIFLIVLLSFRSIIIPLILVLLVQCSVYITVTVVGIQGYSIYYLALLIVECILMGATIDYGILFTNYYRENRRLNLVKEALLAAYGGSVHTIMTSGLIIVLVTGILGYTTSDPTIEQIVRTISIGSLCAILMILFVLPGILAAFDRFTARRERRREH